MRQATDGAGGGRSSVPASVSSLRSSSLSSSAARSLRSDPLRFNRCSLDPIDRRLLDEYQRGFPICEAPFAEIARSLGCKVDEVLQRLAALRRRGVVSRVGPVFAPGRIGASTLAAMAVPSARLESVAASVNRSPGVNHNYEREHEVNLWFVLTAPDAEALGETLADIRRRAGLPVLDLRLEHSYHIDLGFPLWRRPPLRHRTKVTCPSSPPGAAEPLEARDRRLVAAVQGGLPLTARPYAAVAERIGLSAAQVMERLERLVGNGVIKRMGVVVRHHELGYRANAMVVFDAPNDRVDAIGERLAEAAHVTLCYRRTRCPPAWPYNLYCMLHGRERAEVMGWVEALPPDAVADLRRAVLFSRRRFRQCGARYAWDPAPSEPGTTSHG